MFCIDADVTSSFLSDLRLIESFIHAAVLGGWGMIKRQVTSHRSTSSPAGIASSGQGNPEVYRVSAPSASATNSATTTSFARFLWIFTTLGIIVVVVVIGFLIGIIRSLESIDNGLYTASSSVTGAEANVQSLPDYIQTINSALTGIDTALKPIPGQVADVNGSLQSIRGSAQNIDGSLKDTSRALINTSGSLVNTAGALGSADQSLGNTSSGEQPKPASDSNVLQAVGDIVNSIPR
jgi:methyl-accepting chemotaxis protein